MSLSHLIMWRITIVKGQCELKQVTRTLAIALEAVGCCVIAVALVFEYIWKAPMGYIAISAGALVFSVGAMIFVKLYKGVKRDRSK